MTTKDTQKRIRDAVEGTDSILVDGADAFGQSIRLNTQNKADLASHYDYTPERYSI